MRDVRRFALRMSGLAGITPLKMPVPSGDWTFGQRRCRLSHRSAVGDGNA